MHAKRTKFFCAALCVLLLLSLLLSASFLLHAAGHTCAGDDCRICAAVGICTSVLRLLGAAGTAAAILAVCVFGTVLCAACRREKKKVSSLVSLKVKLSD